MPREVIANEIDKGRGGGQSADKKVVGRQPSLRHVFSSLFAGLLLSGRHFSITIRWVVHFCVAGRIQPSLVTLARLSASAENYSVENRKTLLAPEKLAAGQGG